MFASLSSRTAAMLLLQAKWNVAIRTLGDVPGHEFHGNQYAVSGSVVDKRGKSYQVQVTQREYSGNLVPKQTYRVVNEQGHTVASAELRREKKAVSSVWVAPEHQRKGIASVLYKHIEEHLGYKLEPNAALTDEGKAFWKARSASRHPESAVHAAADAHLKAMTVAVTYAFLKGKKAYKSGDDASKAVQVALLESLPPVLLKTLVAGGQAGLGSMRMASLRTLKPQLVGQLHSTSGPFHLAFNVNDLRAARWAREHASKIANDVSQTSKDRIDEAVAASLEGGESAFDEILAAVGDVARAEMIARTEVMTAANEGQRQGWDQAVEAGLLDPDSKRVWIATSEACPECEDLDGEETGLDGEYSGDGGDGPPLHPNCRCTEGIAG